MPLIDKIKVFNFCKKFEKKAFKKKISINLPVKKKPFIIPISIMSIISIIIIILIILLFFQNCTFKNRSIASTISPYVSKNESETTIKNEPHNNFMDMEYLIAPYFKADRRDFENNILAERWFEVESKKIIEALQSNPNLIVEIIGYVSIFQNEIDEYILSEERGFYAKRYFVKNGVPSDKIIVTANGATDNFGTSRKENRVVTIKFIEK